MASLNDFYENAILDHLFGRSSTGLSTGLNSSLFLALWESTATFAETFTALSTGECAGSTYARISVANSSDIFTNAAAGAKSLKAAQDFSTSAGSDWGAVARLVILDSSSTTTGEIITSATFAIQTISAGNTVTATTDLTFNAS